MTARKGHGDQRRVCDLAAIHVMTKQLRMDRGTYEAMLMRVSGVRSSADLNATGRAKVVAELRRLGAPRRDRNKGVPANIANEPMLRKIGALLVELQAPWSYADAIAKRMHRIPFVAWVRKPEQLRAIIAALDAKRLKKRELEAAQ
jgi:phage gp16-like protein